MNRGKHLIWMDVNQVNSSLGDSKRLMEIQLNK